MMGFMANSMFSVAFTVMVAQIVIDNNIAGTNAAWDSGHATFYGDQEGHGTEGEACGYGDPLTEGYGMARTALSTVLFKVTAINQCPGGPGSTCGPPLKHFDLTMPMFLKIAKAPQAGIIPIRFQRTWCTRRLGIRFAFKGNPNFLLVLVSDVGGAGDVVDVKIKGSKESTWWQMKRNWGQNWQTGGNLLRQSISFQVTTSDGKSVWSENVAPANWGFGRTYVGKKF